MCIRDSYTARTSANGELNISIKLPEFSENGKYYVYLISDDAEEQSYFMYINYNNIKELLSYVNEAASADDIYKLLEAPENSFAIDKEKLQDYLKEISKVFYEIKTDKTYTDVQKMINDYKTCLLYTSFISKKRWMVSVKENAYLRVISARSGNSLMIGADKGSGSVSAFINPPAISSNGIFYISFDITADNISNGEMYLSLRSANAGSNNSYDLFKLKSDGKIEYFSGNIDRDGNSAARYSEIKTGERCV